MSALDSLKVTKGESPKPRYRLIGRLTTERYLGSNGALVEKRVFKVLKRKSDLSIHDLINDIDSDIIDLDFSKHEDGIYEVVPHDYSYDIESGIVDDFCIKLVKVEEG